MQSGKNVMLMLMIKVFTVLLRRSETTIAAIIRRRTPGRRRLALKRRLRLALLYTDAILRDLRRAADMLRARTGSRVLAMLNLAARTQRNAIWQAIHGTSAHPKKKKPKGRHAVSGIVIAIPEIPISGFPEIPFSPKSRNSGIFQAKIPEIRDFHFFALLALSCLVCALCCWSIVSLV